MFTIITTMLLHRISECFLPQKSFLICSIFRSFYSVTDFKDCFGKSVYAIFPSKPELANWFIINRHFIVYYY